MVYAYNHFVSTSQIDILQSDGQNSPPMVLHNHNWCTKFLVTVYPKKYAHGFRFAVLCCGYTLTDFPISIRLTSLALWQSNDCPSASKATLMNMDKYFMWNHYERLHNHNKAKHNKTVCIFLGIFCAWLMERGLSQHTTSIHNLLISQNIIYHDLIRDCQIGL